ncbi:MAG: nitrate reductase cytochrome c-type subunit [Rhodocyclaceae bacterium]|nr:nitrate reductase cytochrome c-type subunit [Rhodocyclaceae bacterium]
MKRTFVYSLSLVVAAVLVVGCAEQFAGIKPMRGTDVAAEDKADAPKAYVGGRPGTTKNIARTFSTQPPLIPHEIEKFGDVNLEENSCMDCHAAANYQKKNAPKIGDSHFIDPVTGKKLAESSAARWNCMQCHVPQVDAPPLVENTFVGNVRN